MAWAKKNSDGSGSPATHTYEGGNRASLVADLPNVRSTNVPLSGAGGKKGGYKPAYANTGVGGAGIGHMAPVSRRGGYLGQGGFARIFRSRPGAPANIGAGSATPQGSLHGIFGY